MKSWKLSHRIAVRHKIAGGFAAVLDLLSLVVCFGYFGLDKTTERVEKLDGTGLLLRHNLETRRHKKNFIICGDQDYVGRVAVEVSKQDKLLQNHAPSFENPAYCSACSRSWTSSRATRRDSVGW
jgi:hypothetical protein